MLLNGLGSPLGSGSDAVYLMFRSYKLRDWSALGLNNE